MSETRSRAEIYASLPPDMQAKVITSPEEMAQLEFDWSWWGRPAQFAPAGDWMNWLILAGRGFGKTRAASEWVRSVMCGDTPLTGGRYRHMALVSETAADGRDVLAGDGKQPSNPTAGSGILQVCPPGFIEAYEPSKRRITWKNGSIATLYNATEPEALRGPQHDAAVCDELAKWQYADQTWSQLQFGLRTGTHPRVLISTTPRPTKLLKQIMADHGTVTTRGSTLDNASNLAPSFISSIMRRYEGTRLGRQELFAEVLEDVEGALFNRVQIDASRVKVHQLPVLRRIVISVDPAVSTGEDSDETGIICAGLGDDDRFYILDDVSGRMSPMEWASAAVSLYHARGADRLVCERNNGGEMCEHLIRQVDPNVSYSSVFATRGKHVRMEPVAALAEQNRLSICGSLPQLEDQLCAWSINTEERKAMGHDDRADALCWAITALMEGDGNSEFHFLSVPMRGGRSSASYY